MDKTVQSFAQRLKGMKNEQLLDVEVNQLADGLMSTTANTLNTARPMTSSMLVSPRVARIAGNMTQTPHNDVPMPFDPIQNRELVNNSMETDILKSNI